MYVIVLTNHAHDVVGFFNNPGEASRFLEENGWKRDKPDLPTYTRTLVYTIMGEDVIEIQTAKIVYPTSPHGWTNPLAARIV
ncbi:MAG: hypothetical protein EXS48_03600 [Candidatus Staskawiczbacteria bacterium]|nr:hypothetical protein [Candidatus Staskawiczbacteria bacterium]